MTSSKRFAVFALLALVPACNRSSDVVVVDSDLPNNVVVKTDESVPLPVPTVAAEPAPPVPDASPVTNAAPKYDEKGVSVDFSGTGVFNGFTGEEKSRAKSLKVVRGSGPISVEGLRAFAELPNLVEFLWLDAQLPDDDDAQDAFKAFASSAKLRKVRLTGLKLARGKFPEYALPALAGAPALADLDVSGAPLSAADLGAVDFQTGFKTLTRLNLYQTNAGDDGVAAVLPLADRLTWLNFDDAGISPAAAPQLAKFSELTFLHVGRSALDDSSVDYLSKLSKLEKIHVTRSNVTEEGADRLRAALPNCEVVSKPEN